jgi:AAA+ ATPase superfamily predicted ATPase
MDVSNRMERIDILGEMARAAAKLTAVGRVVARFDVVSYVFGGEGIELSSVKARLDELTTRLEAVAAVEAADVAIKVLLEEQCQSIREEWDSKCEANEIEEIEEEARYEARGALIEGGHEMCSGVCADDSEAVTEREEQKVRTKQHKHTSNCYSVVPNMGPGQYLVCGCEWEE